MKTIKLTALALILPLMLASCSIGKIKGNPSEADKWLRYTCIHPEGSEDPIIENVIFCSSDDENEYTLPTSGTHVNVRGLMSEYPDEEPHMTMYIFPSNEEFVWSRNDAIVEVEGRFENTDRGAGADIGTYNAMLFSFDLEENFETGDYTFVFVNDKNKVDSMFTTAMVGSINESTVGEATSNLVFPWDYYPSVDKPVIYLYPEETTEMYVNVDFEGEFNCTYPQRNEQYGWHVEASPDGTIYNIDDGRTYDYIFWDGFADVPDSFEHSVCVRGCDTAAFLEEYLEASGLNSSEIDDFISFWLPQMQNNPYNLISFPTEEYEQMADLQLSVTPDTVIRVYMVFTALDSEVQIAPEDQLVMPSGVERSGFTVVEWGGSEV